MGEELGEKVGMEWVSMEKRPPQKAAATKANPGAQSEVSVAGKQRARELWFGGGVCGCKSGGEPPHSKLG